MNSKNELEQLIKQQSETLNNHLNEMMTNVSRDIFEYQKSINTIIDQKSELAYRLNKNIEIAKLVKQEANYEFQRNHADQILDQNIHGSIIYHFIKDYEYFNDISKKMNDGYSSTLNLNKELLQDILYKFQKKGY